jgi:carboxypeptidase Taq
MLDMSREYSNFFPEARHIADPLIAASDYGMSAVSIQAIFAELRAQLVPMVQAITSQPPMDNSCLHQHYPEAEQLAFCHSILKQMGYDFERGRQDKTLHPFMTKFSIDYPSRLGVQFNTLAREITMLTVLTLDREIVVNTV